MSDDLTALLEQANCLHPLHARSGDNDYIKCSVCGFTWDYRKDPIGLRAMIVQLAAALREEKNGIDGRQFKLRIEAELRADRAEAALQRAREEQEQAFEAGQELQWADGIGYYWPNSGDQVFHACVADAYAAYLASRDGGTDGRT